MCYIGGAVFLRCPIPQVFIEPAPPANSHRHGCLISASIGADPGARKGKATPMVDQREKIALFIDGANLYATAKSLGFDIDYKRLLLEFQSKGYLLRAYYYTALAEDQEYSSIRPLIDWL